jgi:long-chain acyl-CoA synthetase
MTESLRFETLVELLERAVAQFGERPAYGSLASAPASSTSQSGTAWSWITFNEFARRVAACRAGLADLGVGRGDRVAIIAENRLEWVIAAHATYQRRAVFVPVAELQSEPEWRYVLADSAAKVCFVGNASLAGRVNGIREDLLDLQHIVTLDGTANEPSQFDALLARGEGRDIPARAPSRADIATIIYTSGTTGEPKGVRLSHGNLAANALALAEARDFGTDLRSVAFLPWAHVFGGQVELNVMMALGASVAICPSADRLFDEMQRLKPTVLYAVPRMWSQIYHDMQRNLAAEPEMSRHMFDDALQLMKKQRAGETLKLTERIYLNLCDRVVISKLKARLGGKLRWAFSGAAPLPVPVAEMLHDVGITIYEGYGLTESSGSSTSNPTGAARFGTVGKAMGETRIVIDTSVAEALPGEGEILLYGPGIMQGYHNQPELTAQVLMPDGGLRTGDLGRLDDDGYLWVTGRIKDLYKLSNGRYVAPAPLEQKLKMSPFIEHCMVYGAGQPYNVALIVADVRSLRAYLGVEEGNAEELIADPRARRLYEEEILKCSRDFRTFELVRSFWLATEPFTRENGMLTSAMKLRRRRVLQVYETKLRSLY